MWTKKSELKPCLAKKIATKSSQEFSLKNRHFTTVIRERLYQLDEKLQIIITAKPLHGKTKVWNCNMGSIFNEVTTITFKYLLWYVLQQVRTFWNVFGCVSIVLVLTYLKCIITSASLINIKTLFATIPSNCSSICSLLCVYHAYIRHRLANMSCRAVIPRCVVFQFSGKQKYHNDRTWNRPSGDITG